ncbi:unnamed protein product, partial [marine sediment metagenome]
MLQCQPLFPSTLSMGGPEPSRNLMVAGRLF